MSTDLELEMDTEISIFWVAEHFKSCIPLCAAYLIFTFPEGRNLLSWIALLQFLRKCFTEKNKFNAA